MLQVYIPIPRFPFFLSLCPVIFFVLFLFFSKRQSFNEKIYSNSAPGFLQVNGRVNKMWREMLG